MAEITALSDLSDGTAPSLATMIALRDSLLVVQHNLLAGNGTFGGIDYEERGDLGFKAVVSTKLKALKEAIDQLNQMIKDPSLVTDTDLATLYSSFDNPLLVEVDINGNIRE